MPPLRDSSDSRASQKRGKIVDACAGEGAHPTAFQSPFKGNMHIKQDDAFSHEAVEYKLGHVFRTARAPGSLRSEILTKVQQM